MSYLSYKGWLAFLNIPNTWAVCLEKSVFACFASLSCKLISFSIYLAFVKAQDSFIDENFLSSVFSQIRRGNPHHD